MWNCVSRMCRIGTNTPPMTLPILSTTDMSNLATDQSVSVAQTPIVERCGTCLFRCDLGICRAPFKVTIPKRIRNKLPKGVGFDRHYMRPDQGEDCTFWKTKEFGD